MKEFSQILNELASVDKGTNIKGPEFYIIWGNGHLLINPSREDSLKVFSKTGLDAIQARGNRNKKQVEMHFFDDWSDFKFIHKIQQMLKDLIKANYIDSSWSCIIFDKSSTLKNLGSINVGKILNYDSSFSKVIPVCFHGTSDFYLKDIQKNGLQPIVKSKVERNWDKGYTDESKYKVYMSIDYNRAHYYADYTVDALNKKGIQSKPIVIKIKNLPIDNTIMPDDDFETNMGMLQLMQYLKTGKKADTGSLVQSIRNSSQFAIKNSIPSSMFDKIYK